MPLTSNDTAHHAWGSDGWLMANALRMARFGLGTTAPNPSVGAVLYRPDLDRIVGRGVTQPGGRPHAEPVAIAAAGPLAQGATMAVTLEPCSHHGRSPPCVDAILANGITRVVYAAVDPDPRVAGRGLRLLREGGVEVVPAPTEQRAAARWVTRGHILRVTERRPLVTVKIAVDAMGQIQVGTGSAPTWVTGQAARRHGHMLRAMSDAICIGTGTVLADDPELTCRLPGLEARSPRRVVIGSRPLPPTAKLANASQDVRVVQFRPRPSSATPDGEDAPVGLDIRAVSQVADRVWLPDVLEALAADGVTRLLVEGGPGLWRAFAAARLVDEVVVFHARGAQLPVSETTDPFAVLERYCPVGEMDIVGHRPIGSDDMWVLRTREAAGWREAGDGQG